MICRGLLALTLPFASTALAEGFLLQPPLDCDLSQTCYIQQYMDHDPGPGSTDYTCAGLSYEGHKGTDFALPTRKEMAAGVDVLAGAPGIVLGTRDGMDDDGYTPDRRAELEGRECGNGVVVQHDAGWQTQYCHLKQGSVAVTKNQIVETGTILGQIGQSGNAAFPHVHLSVRDPEGAPIDPFDPDGVLTCGSPGDSTLWADPPNYRAGGLLSLGFATTIPDYGQIKAGTAAVDTLSPDAPALVIFAYYFGPQKGDTLRLDITGPKGSVITQDIDLPKDQAQAFRAIGKKRRSAPWPAGTYTGTATLIRDETPIDQKTTQITLR
jgi:hypothetical protein